MIASEKVLIVWNEERCNDFSARLLRDRERVLNLNPCNRLSWVQIIGEYPGRATLDCRGNNHCIPEVDPSLVLNLKGPFDLFRGVAMHQYEKSSTMARASSFGTREASFRVTVE